MTEPVVQVENLVKTYDQLRAVDDITFQIQKGEVFAFLGPNGAGKTTTVEILECLRPLTGGTARVLGYDVTDKTQTEEIKKRIGVLPQAFSALEKLTVKENIDLIGDMYASHLSADEVIKQLDLEDKTNQKFDTLSGGLKQRVGVAAALVSDPQLVFLDEPTTGLDPKARREVWTVIENLRNTGKTVFLTTHYMEEAQILADRIAIIDKGKIVAIGPPSELIAEHGGHKTLIIRKANQKLATTLQTKHGQTRLNNHGDVYVEVEDTDEFWDVMNTLTQLRIDNQVEIQTPTIEDVFLKIVGAKITEEGELRQ
jgi:ABC-2 type transport system ATP-binding protein